MILLEYVSYLKALSGAIENKHQFSDCACLKNFLQGPKSHGSNICI